MLLRGTAGDVLCQLRQLQHEQKSTGLRVEVDATPSFAFEIKFNSKHLHIGPMLCDMSARVHAWALSRGLFPDLREIRISTFVAPYLERALESAANGFKNPGMLYICFDASACTGVASAAVVRCMQAIPSAAAISRREVQVAVVHRACACASHMDVRHEFLPHMWAVATQAFFNSCEPRMGSVLHEFANNAHDEIAFVNACHRLLPTQNWCTIGVHRITFPSGYKTNALVAHTSRWTSYEWSGGRVLQLRDVSQQTQIPVFDSLVPICGTVSVHRMKQLGCWESAGPIAMNLLQNRKWAEGVTLHCSMHSFATETALQADNPARVSKLCVDITNADEQALSSTIKYMRGGRNTIHTLKLRLPETQLTRQAIETVLRVLGNVPNLRHLIVSGVNSAFTGAFVVVLLEKFKHATLRELTLPVSDEAARLMGNLFARDANDLPNLDQLNVLFDANIARNRIDRLLSDYTEHPNLKRLAGVSITVTHENQQAPAAVFLKRLVMASTCLRSLEVHTANQPAAPAAAGATEFPIANAILDCAPFLTQLERLVLHVPVPVHTFNTLVASNAGANDARLATMMHLRTLHLNVQMFDRHPTSQQAADKFWRVVATQAATLRDLRVNADFVDSFRREPNVVWSALIQLRLSAADVQHSVFSKEFQAAVAEYGTTDASACASACALLSQCAGLRRA